MDALEVRLRAGTLGNFTLGQLRVQRGFGGINAVVSTSSFAALVWYRKGTFFFIAHLIEVFSKALVTQW